MSRFSKILLLIIIVLAFGLRIYKVDSVPPAISWDEAAFGVNANFLANHARDEYGQLLPLFFKSFGDDKHPVHIYLTAIPVKFFGLNEFSVRLPSVLFGVGNVMLIYFLTYLLFGKKELALIAALFLAISPYSIHFSRFNHEANFVLFFFLLGLTLFFYFIKTGQKLLPLAILSFGVCFITYHNAKVLVPVTIFTLGLLYYKKIIKDRAGVLISLIIILTFSYLVFLNPQLLGLARIKQTSQGLDEVKNTRLYQSTNNEFLGKVNLAFDQYLLHFTPQFLFFQGDKNPRLSFQTGEFHKIDALFLIVGLLALTYKGSRASLVLIVWALVAPLPSSLVAEAPHAARASFIMGSFNIIAALGFFTLINLARKNALKIAAASLGIFILGYSLFNHLSYYFDEYAKRYAIDWQYGMKQITEFIREHKEYNQVYMTDVRHQPYIFFLFYLKTPLPVYLNTVAYNTSNESKSYNLVSYYDKHFFGGWEVVESTPNPGVLYILTPSEYDGLRHKGEFDIKKHIRYPDGTDAFYLVSKI